MAEQSETKILAITATNPPELRGRTYFIGHDRLDHYIGRSRRADVPLDDPSVSHVHARLRWHGDAVVIRDLNTRNGSAMNGRTFVGARYLHDGDAIRLGGVELRVEQVAVAAATSR